MSGSLHSWIAHYLVDVAQVHGGNLSVVPPHENGKKAQIIKFLTFGTEGAIWAELSDGSHKLPVKFTKDAVNEYERQRNRRFTEISPMIVSIKSFKPIFTRVPKGNNSGMSLKSSLVLECHQVSVLGACGEACFGNPKEIESHPDLQLWSTELGKDGGGANILRDRKRKLEQATSVGDMVSKPQDRPKQTHVSHTTSIQPARNLAPIKNEKQVRRHIQKLRGPPKEIRLILDDLPIHGDPLSAPEIPALPPVKTPPKNPRDEPPLLLSGTSKNGSTRGTRSRSATPLSGWSPTPNRVHSSPARHDHDDPLKSKLISARSGLIDVPSSIPAPTPAQRVKPSSLPQISPAPLSSFPIDESLLSARNANNPTSPFLQRQVQRRVPLPLPKSVTHGEGPPLVLVPNSDTSMTASQSILLSQSQSQSQRRKESEGSGFLKAEDEKESGDQRILDGQTKDLAPEFSSQDEVYDGDLSSPERLYASSKLKLYRKVALKPESQTHSRNSLQKSEIFGEKDAEDAARLDRLMDEDDAHTDVQLFGSKGRVDQARCDPTQHDAKVWAAPSFFETHKNSAVNNGGLLFGGIDNQGTLSKYPWPTRREYEDIVLRAKGLL